jgi:hypothetical protein
MTIQNKKQTKTLGDILKGKNRDRDAAFHFIVFLDDNDKTSFVGTMLTRCNKYKDNILMSENHFNKTDTAGNSFEFQFKNTHLVKRRLIKLEGWGPFEKIGELTTEGIKFVKSATDLTEPVIWDDYLREQRMYEN